MSLAYSRRELSKRVELAGLSKELIEGHSLIIGGATAYAISLAADVSTAGFMSLWASGARLDYMNADD